MPPTVSLTPYYRYFALVCFGVTSACVAGMIAYEVYIGPLPKGAQYGIWFAQMMSPAAATANRFVQNHRRSPTEGEKKKLTRVSLGLAVAINALPSIAIVYWFYAMAFVVGDPAYELVYYVYRQKAVSLLAFLGPGLWTVAVGLFALFLTISYFMIRGQYGRAAQKMAARLSPP